MKDLKGKKFAYVVIASDFKEGEGYLVGIAIENEPGYYETDWRWAGNGDYNLAQQCADEKNIKLHGSLIEAYKIITSTMFDVDYRHC